eukprot:scaffold44680_cov19-Tisochrysis_lutea.AAC.1
MLADRVRGGCAHASCSSCMSSCKALDGQVKRLGTATARHAVLDWQFMAFVKDAMRIRWGWCGFCSLACVQTLPACPRHQGVPVTGHHRIRSAHEREVNDNKSYKKQRKGESASGRKGGAQAQAGAKGEAVASATGAAETHVAVLGAGEQNAGGQCAGGAQEAGAEEQKAGGETGVAGAAAAPGT